MCGRIIGSCLLEWTAPKRRNKRRKIHEHTKGWIDRDRSEDDGEIKVIQEPEDPGTPVEPKGSEWKANLGIRRADDEMV